LSQNFTKVLGPGQIIWLHDLSYRKTDIRFGKWNVRSLYRAGSLMTAVKAISKHKLDLVGVQEVRQDRGGTEPAGEYTFFYRKRNENHQLGTDFIHT
jgi:hypothetical protein